MSYVIRKVSSEELNRVRKELPFWYEIAKRVFEGESLSSAESKRIRERGGLPYLEIDGVKYTVKYSKKRKAIGIFIKRNGIENLVKNDLLLDSDQKKIIENLWYNIKTYIDIHRISNNIDWGDNETEQQYFDRLHRN